MIQKESFLKPSDKSGIFFVKTFHLYKGFVRKNTFVGNFIKVSVRAAKPDAVLRKKSKSIALFVKSRFITNKLDGSYIKFFENSCILIKRKLILRNKDITGPGDRKLMRRKLMYKFPGIL